MIKLVLDSAFTKWILLIVIIIGGFISIPNLEEKESFFPIAPLQLDALPDLSENQQIISTNWKGQSTEDIELQVTNPLMNYISGLPDVKSVRGLSQPGISYLFVIFDESQKPMESRSLLTERLSSLPNNLLPFGVHSILAPDALPTGQVLWYSIEGAEEQTNKWGLHELRSLHEYELLPALMSVGGVAEVASIGGYEKQYQIVIDPLKMKSFELSYMDFSTTLKKAGDNVGGGFIEINQVEYIIQGKPNLSSTADLEDFFIKVHKGIRVVIKDVAQVIEGPASRRGVLDVNGQEAVGGVVTIHRGEDPLSVIKAVKEKMSVLEGAAHELNGECRSSIKFNIHYNRSTLIKEAITKLKDTIELEIILTVLVILLITSQIKKAFIAAAIIPMSILATFLVMRFFGVKANILSLSGIALALGTLVDIGIVFTESQEKDAKSFKTLIPVVLTSVATTVVSFFPVFFLSDLEGKIFEPLAITKSLVLVLGFFVAVLAIPLLSNARVKGDKTKNVIYLAVYLACLITFMFLGIYMLGVLFLGYVIIRILFIYRKMDENRMNLIQRLSVLVVLFYCVVIKWLPLGSESLFIGNVLVTLLIFGSIILCYLLLLKKYEALLAWCLGNKRLFFYGLSVIVLMSLFMSFGNKAIGLTLGAINKDWKDEFYDSSFGRKCAEALPGLHSTYMPSLDEGSFLYMPVSSTHSGVGYNRDLLQLLDTRIGAIPEVSCAMGKVGKVNSAMDPAPLNMYEVLITYQEEFRFKGQTTYKKTDNKFLLKNEMELTNDEFLELGISLDQLVEDSNGKPFRNWRSHIKTSDDIWKEITKVTSVPGLTSAPKLYPIETRTVMLKTGFSGNFGIKVYGNDIKEVQLMTSSLAEVINSSGLVNTASTYAEKIQGKPYLNIEYDRKSLSSFGVNQAEIEALLSLTFSNRPVATLYEGKQRFQVVLDLPKSYKSSPSSIERLSIRTNENKYVTLGQLATISYELGPQMIKSEDGFVTSYITLAPKEGMSEELVASELQEYLNGGEVLLKKEAGVYYEIIGSYKDQKRAFHLIMFIIPITILIIS